MAKQEYEKFRLMKITNLNTGKKELLYETNMIRSIKKYIKDNNIEPSPEIVIEMDNAHENTTRELFLNDFMLEAGKTFKGVYGAYTLRKFT